MISFTLKLVPGTNQCGAGWHVEYTGALMSEWSGALGGSEAVCVDSSHDYIPGTQANEDQSVMHYVITGCGSLPCPPYQAGRVITCAVCSK
jgi:hypothetical protein